MDSFSVDSLRFSEIFFAIKRFRRRGVGKRDRAVLREEHLGARLLGKLPVLALSVFAGNRPARHGGLSGAATDACHRSALL